MKIIITLLALLLALLSINSCMPAEDITNTDRGDASEMNCTNSQDKSQDAIAQIEQTKKEIEQALLENYDIFTQIVDYFEEDPREFSINIESDELIIVAYEVGQPRNTAVEIDANKVAVIEQIRFVLNDLEFTGIGADTIGVGFLKPGGVHPYGGSYWQSLVCNKKDAGENKTQERYDLPFGETVRIKDEWFYVYGRNNS